MRVEEKNGKLIISDFNEFDAYRIAANIEEDGIKFYQKVAEASNKTEAKKTLEFLRQEEEKHLNFFQGRLEVLREKEVDSCSDKDLSSSVDFGIFQPYKKIGEIEKMALNIEKALSFGVVIEDKSIEFYAACRRHILSQATKDEISRIIDEEMSHKEKLVQLMREEKSK